MKRLIYGLLLGFFFAGCATTGEKSESGSDKGTQASDGAGAIAEEMDGGPSQSSGKSAPVIPESGSARPAKNDAKYKSLSNALRDGRENEIVEEASKILGANASDPVALNSLAMYHFKQGRIGAAKILLDKAFEKNPNNASLLNNLAILQMAEKENRQALQTLKKAYRIDDNNSDVLGNLGSLYVQGGDFTKALPLLERAYKANKSNASVAANYAIALRAAKNYDKAASIYEGLIESDSKNVAVHLNYAILLIDYMNKPKEGLAHAVKVKFLETDRKDVLDRANELEKKARAEIK